MFQSGMRQTLRNSSMCIILLLSVYNNKIVDLDSVKLRIRYQSSTESLKRVLWKVLGRDHGNFHQSNTTALCDMFPILQFHSFEIRYQYINKNPQRW